MGTPNRAARFVSHHLDQDEALLASVVGVECKDDWSRRRMAVAATTRRVLVVWLRPATPMSVPYDELAGLDVQTTVEGARITVRTGDDEIVVQRILDQRAAELLGELVAGRVGDAAPEQERPGRVRIVT